MEKHKFDLVTRTIKFGENIIDFCAKVKYNPITNPLISQLVRAGTSVGANYCEASESVTKKDFINKICISKKEAKETQFWLQMIIKADPLIKKEADILYQEAHELILIFAATIRNKQ